MAATAGARTVTGQAHLHAADFEPKGGLRGLLVLYPAALDVGGVGIGVPCLVAHLHPSHSLLTPLHLHCGQYIFLSRNVPCPLCPVERPLHSLTVLLL